MPRAAVWYALLLVSSATTTHAWAHTSSQSRAHTAQRRQVSRDRTTSRRRDVKPRRDVTRRAQKQPLEQTSTSRRSVLALAFPIAFGLASQAPLVSLIVSPPDASTREGMLESWCSADYCTLLGGGAGYSPGYASFPGNYVEPEGGVPAMVPAEGVIPADASDGM